MMEEREPISVVESTPRWILPAVVLLAFVSLAALGLGWAAASSAGRSEQDVATQVVSMKKSTDLLNLRLGQAEQANAKAQGDLNVVMDRLKLTSNELARARKQAVP